MYHSDTATPTYVMSAVCVPPLRGVLGEFLNIFTHFLRFSSLLLLLQGSVLMHGNVLGLQVL